jgi:hypothetical protein
MGDLDRARIEDGFLAFETKPGSGIVLERYEFSTYPEHLVNWKMVHVAVTTDPSITSSDGHGRVT